MRAGTNALLLVLILIGPMLLSAKGQEMTEYKVERSEGAFEVRIYPPLVVAEVTTSGDRSAAVRDSFVRLADYIFAKNRTGEKIAMTAPVTQAEDKGSWTVRFIMPRGLGIQSLPKPAGDVRLVEVPAQRMAAVRFSGRWTDRNFSTAEAKLLSWTRSEGLDVIGPATFAYYNAPFTPWFLRRNEVLFAVKP